MSATLAKDYSDLVISVARVQADLGYGEPVRVNISGETFTGIIATVDARYMTVRLDDNRIICDYPMRKIEYFMLDE